MVSYLAVHMVGSEDQIENDEELIEIVPDLVWYIVRPGRQGAEPASRPENLRLPVHTPANPPEPSLRETLVIVALIHLLFEMIR